MKNIQRIMIVLFAMILLLPCLFFNFNRQAISDIDNRMLAQNPFENFGLGFTDQMEDYVNDRMGFREEMITAYTNLNDAVFNKLTHPSYVKGQEGHIYGTEAVTQKVYGEYHVAFANMVEGIYRYCQQRNVPFLFVLNPAKSAVYPEFLPDGVQPERECVTRLLAELEQRGVPVLDNTETLLQQKQNGEQVFNQKYDANHWNDWGAYYGTNAILQTLQNMGLKTYVNQKSDLSIASQTQTRLLNSVYAIEEEISVISLDTTYQDLSASFKEELALNASYRFFGYYRNSQRLSQQAPKALVFQGSYMNSAGLKYLAGGLGEYVAVHDYQNVIDFPYYYNVFQPDCVVFEVAEYTITNDYFDQTAMEEARYQPPLSRQKQQGFATLNQKPDPDAITVEKGAVLTKLTFAFDQPVENAWLCLDGEYDMKQTPEGLVVTIPTEVYEKYSDKTAVVIQQNQTLITYQNP